MLNRKIIWKSTNQMAQITKKKKKKKKKNFETQKNNQEKNYIH